MKICCYGICKNEIKFIDRMLDSIKDADYFAFLDTGSTDGTYEKLLELQKDNPEKYFIAQREIKPWRFDTARNASMELVPEDADVCVSVDFDDVFPANWRKIVEEKIEAGYNKIIARYCYYENDTPVSTIFLDRVSINKKAHWENGIHERLVADDENSVDAPEFIVEHRQDCSKDRRDIYLEAAIESAKDSDYGKLCLGYEYFNSGKFALSASTFENLYETLKDTDSSLITRKMLLVLATAYGELGLIDEEISAYKRILEIKNSGSPLEDEINFSDQFETKISEYIQRFNDEFKMYWKGATEYFNQGQLLLAVSHMDICWALNKLRSVRHFKNLFSRIYLNYISEKIYDKNKVAIYAICKNERAFVERWVDSMREADYICVLDTGSTDGTYETFVEMSKKNPKIIVSRVEIQPWRFDIPRNIAMSLVPDDANILLSTDLDEILEPGWYEDLTSNWEDGVHERANYQYAWSHTLSGANGRVFWYNKVHTRKWIWRYPVHELLYNLETGSEDYPSSQGVNLNKMFLHHFPDTSKSRGNYLPLLEQRAIEDENDTYGLIYLAHEYNYRGYYQNSIDLYNNVVLKRIDENDTLMRACSYLFMGDDYVALKNVEMAEECYKKAIESDPTYREAYLNLAQVYVDTGRHQEAIKYIKDAINNSVRHYSWLERDISWTYQPFDLLALAYFYTGDKVRAYASAIQAAQLEPADGRLQNNVKLIKESLTDKDWGV